MNASAPRLVALTSAFLLLALGSFWLTLQALDFTPGNSGLALGMAWLKKEYQLDDSTFSKVTDAHRLYFRDCEKRCTELDDLNSHFLNQLKADSTPKSDIDAVHILQENLCIDCRIAMITHVHEVAALMPAQVGRRFITDIKTALDPTSNRKSRPSR